MINSVTLVGRITKDIELKYTNNNITYAYFTLAVNREFASQNGEKETDFINCVAWRTKAEILANYMRKGSLIGIEGRLQTRNYENQAGQRVYVTEVLTESISFLESKGSQHTNNNTFSNGEVVDISDDDLPF